MNFGYRPPKKEVDQRPPEMVLINEDEVSCSPTKLIQQKMQGTPDTTKLVDDLVGGDNWEFQMDPFDTWSHEKENDHHRRARVDPEMPRRSFLDKALCRKPKLMEGNFAERIICKSNNRSKSVPRSHRTKSSHRKPEALFGTPPPMSTPSKYNQHVDEFIEVSATPKQLNRVSDLSEIEKREKEQQKIMAMMHNTPPPNNSYSLPILAPKLDDGNSVVVDVNASLHKSEIVSVSPERSIIPEPSNSVLSSIQCTPRFTAPLCSAGEMIFMAVGPEENDLIDNKAASPPPPPPKPQKVERIHRSMPVSNNVYVEESLASSFQGRNNENNDFKKTRVQSYSPNKQNIYDRDAFEEEIRMYQKHLRESRMKLKMDDIEETREYGEAASAGDFDRRAMHHTPHKPIEPSKNPIRGSRSVGRSEASSYSSSSSYSTKSREFVPGRSARRRGRSKSAPRSAREETRAHTEEKTNDIPRKRSDFMISGMEMVAGDIARHRSGDIERRRSGDLERQRDMERRRSDEIDRYRSQPKKETHHRNQQRPTPEITRRTRIKPEWMMTPEDLLKKEREVEPRATALNDLFECGPVPIVDIITMPSPNSDKLPIKTVEIPVMVEGDNDEYSYTKKEDLRIVDDATDLDSATFDEYDADSIYKDLKKSEKRRSSLRSVRSYDASEKYSRYSRKSAATRHTDFTHGSASVELDGCF